MPAKSTRAMSDDHKAALAAGRTAGNAVRQYLEALEWNKPKRGRRRTADTITKRLEAIELELNEASPIRRLNLLQEQEDLTEELQTVDTEYDITEYEQAFIEHAAAYGASKGISYATWRAMGIKPEILRKAGIGRSS